MDIIEDFTLAMRAASDKRIEAYLADRAVLTAAVVSNDEAAMKSILESPRFVIIGPQLDALRVAAQAVIIFYPDDWAEAFAVAEARHGVAAGSVLRIVNDYVNWVNGHEQ